jgi:hypothetical protein
MEEHELERAAGRDRIRYERIGLSVESKDDGETFVVRHGDRVQICPGLVKLEDCLSTL